MVLELWPFENNKFNKFAFFNTPNFDIFGLPPGPIFKDRVSKLLYINTDTGALNNCPALFKYYKNLELWPFEKPEFQKVAFFNTPDFRKWSPPPGLISKYRAFLLLLYEVKYLGSLKMCLFFKKKAF